MDKFKTVVAIVSGITAILALLATLAGGILWLNTTYATNKRLAVEIVDARLEGLEDDTEQDAAWAAHLRRLMREGTATPAELDRLDRFEKQIERKYLKTERLEAMQAILERPAEQ